ncbi:MAG TPA: hypothetical protein VMA75_04915 [Candidatus Paceibacterota bacterium]|nr:hypothetical protein [Candidatus Paceibacterota bacterium]
MRIFDSFRRKGNGTAVLEAEPIVVPAKVQLQPTIGEAELADYMKLADKVKFAPPELLRHRLIQFLLENHVEVYPLQSVEKYLDQKFGKPVSQDGYDTSYEHKWGWHPLRAEDDGKLVNHKERKENGHIQKGATYRKIIPAPVLETTDLIATHFAGSEPTLHFYVADAVVPSMERDPFLGITAVGLNFIVIERWDEPAFRR